MEYMNVKINGQAVRAESEMTILDAAEAAGISIPRLCYLKDLTPGSACRMCLVEVKGMAGMVTACTTAVREGMEVETETERLRRERKINLELICSNHRMDCTYCSRFPYCELQDLCRKYGIDDRLYRFARTEEIDDSAKHLVRDNSKCIVCGRCVAACEKQGVNAIGVSGRGIQTKITPGACGMELDMTDCIGCGQCINACPTAALQDKDNTREIYRALTQRKKKTVAVVEPEVLKQLGECLLDKGVSDTSGKTVGILKKIGFERVFSTEDFRTTGEELIQTYCPAVIHMCERKFPDLAVNFSYPMQKAAKTGMKKYYSSYRREDIFVAGITTCTAIKKEVLPEVNAVITVRELASMVYRFCISHFTALEVWKETKEEFCDALREGISVKAETPINRTKHISVTGYQNVEKILKAVSQERQNKESVRLFACPGGCENGGGRPRRYAGK